MMKSAAPQMISAAKQRQAMLAKMHAQFSKSGEAMEVLHKTKAEMDKLVNLGDSVTEDDVMRAAGSFVSFGADPHKVATMLADTPQAGPQLAQWVAKQDSGLKATMAKTLMQREKLRKGLLGASAAHVAKSIAERASTGMPMQVPQAPAPAAAPNPLMQGLQ